MLALSIRSETDEIQAYNHSSALSLWAFGNRLLSTVIWGGDSPNALPEDAPHLDVLKIDTMNVSAADFTLDGATRAKLVANGWRAVAAHLADCGHVRQALHPPDWLVEILSNYSNGDLPLL